MDVSEPIRIPISSSHGIIGYSLVDAVDAYLARWSWCLTRGYMTRGTKVGGRRETIRMHRQVLGLTRGDGLIVDHINRDRLDNRRANLRVVTVSENNQNVAGHGRSTSLFRGVSWNSARGMWRAEATVDRRAVFLGWYGDELRAADAARDFRLLHMPGAVD